MEILGAIIIVSFLIDAYSNFKADKKFPRENTFLKNQVHFLTKDKEELEKEIELLKHCNEVFCKEKEGAETKLKNLIKDIKIIGLDENGIKNASQVFKYFGIDLTDKSFEVTPAGKLQEKKNAD